MPPRCPLCPNQIQFQCNMMQLAWHLKRYHNLENSAQILSRAMCASQVGYLEVLEVLKDVENINKENLSNRESIKNLKMEIKEMTNVKKKTIQKITTVDKFCQTEVEFVPEEDKEQKGFNDLEIAELKKVQENTTIDKFCQTESEVDQDEGKEQEGFNDLEIDELKRNISQKRSNVEWLNNKILDTEIKLIMHHRKEKIKVSENELTRQVSKSEQIKKEMKLSEKCNKELKLKVDELTNEKEKYRKVTSQLIESQREVHEKEIQDLNLKLQNQINKSQVLKAREKSLMDEVEMLKATISKNNEQNQYLTNQVKSLQLKVLEEQVKVADVDAICLRQKIATSEKRIHKLEKEIECLEDRIYKQGKEYADFKHHSKEIIAERDNRINCLEHQLRCLKENSEITENELQSLKENSEITANELQCFKADSGIILEEIEKRTNEKIECEKQIAELKDRLVLYKETMTIMKNSLTGLVAMHEETSDKVIEVFRNTSRISQETLNDLNERFIRFEKESDGEFSSVGDFNKNIIIKTEKTDLEIYASPSKATTDSDMEGCKIRSFNEDLVAQDFSCQFDRYFGGSDSSRKNDEDEDGSGSGSSMGSSRSKFKKRKLFSIV